MGEGHRKTVTNSIYTFFWVLRDGLIGDGFVLTPFESSGAVAVDGRRPLSYHDTLLTRRRLAAMMNSIVAPSPDGAARTRACQRRRAKKTTGGARFLFMMGIGR